VWINASTISTLASVMVWLMVSLRGEKQQMLLTINVTSVVRKDALRLMVL
jgi:hypothetical protein